MATLLIGDPASTWREFLRSRKSDSPLAILDPSDSEFGASARFKVFADQKLIWERFYGSLDPLRSPHVLVGWACRLRERFGPDLDVLLFDYRPNPILKQTISIVAQHLNSSQIYISSKAEIDLGGFPVGPETIDLPVAFPPLVKQAQRRARWLKMLEECQIHRVELRRVSLENCRLGSGRPLSAKQLEQAGIESSYGEIGGETLFLITAQTLDEDRLARAMALTQTRRTVVTAPSKYENLLCSFADQEGEDFGFGKIETVDWSQMIATIRCTPPPPAPLRILRLGTLRVDDLGAELGETRPWEV